MSSGRERDQVVQDLLRELVGPSPRGALVLGPRGSGRTTVLRRLGEVLTERAAGESRVRYAYVDLRPYEGEARQAMVAIAKAIAGATDAPASDATVQGAVAAALRVLGADRLVVGLDNFDRVGPFLDLELQATLRSAFYTGNGGKVFVVVTSCTPLQDCLEHLAERNSEAVDIVGPTPRWLRPLGRQEVVDWLKREGLAGDVAEGWAGWLYVRLGGFLAWLRIAVDELLCGESGLRSVIAGTPEAPASELELVVRTAVQGRLNQDRGYLTARQLYLLENLSARSVLDGGEDAFSRLVVSGWLAANESPAGEWIKPPPLQALPPHPQHNQFEQLVEAIERLNLFRWRSGSRTDAVDHELLLSRRVQPYLRRPCRTRGDAEGLVSALHTLLSGDCGSMLPRVLHDDLRSPLRSLKLWQRALSNHAAAIERPWPDFGSQWIKGITDLIGALVDPETWESDERLREAMVACGTPIAPDAEAPRANDASARPAPRPPVLRISNRGVFLGGAIVDFKSTAYSNALRFLAENALKNGGPTIAQELTKCARWQDVGKLMQNLRDKLASALDGNAAARERVAQAVSWSRDSAPQGRELVFMLLPSAQGQSGYLLALPPREILIER